jgi:tRNA(Arg) A34 adenosine deaminase TadA
MKIWKSLAILLIVVLLLLLLWPLTGRTNERAEISLALKDTLTSLAAAAARNGDVPIASVLLYNNIIIGAASNTVISGNNAGGHAEINAISEAFIHLGYKQFKDLDRSKLVLVTTFEPCAMCRSAIAEYRIHNLRIIKYKKLKNHWKSWLQNLRVYWNSWPAGESSMQDSLFELNSNFNKVNSDL